MRQLRELGRWGSGGTPKAGTPEYYGGDIPWYKIGDLADGYLSDSQDTLTPAGLRNSSAKLVPPGTLLIAMYGSIGKLGITTSEAATNQAIAFCRPDESQVLLPFLFYYLLYRRKHLISLGRGGTQQNISQTVLLAEMAPVPPIDTQRRIVAAVEALFGEIDDGEEALGRARRELKTYRKSLLKAAVTGELTAEWRAANMTSRLGADLVQDILAIRSAREGARMRKAGAKVDISSLRRLPSEWAWTRVDIAGDVLLGRQRAPVHHSGEHMRPYLRVANVLEARLDLNDVKHMNFTPAEFVRFALQPGDVLLNEGQAPELLGRPALYRGEIEGCCFQKTLLRFRPEQGIEPEFALLVFRHYMHSGRFLRENRITTNIGHLTQVRFCPMEFPVPPTEEQRRIVELVSEMESEAVSLLEHVESPTDLRQAILSAAFGGELVQ